MALPELQDGTQSKQKAEYVSHTLSKRGKSDYIELTYKRLDGPNPGAESKTGNFVTALDESSRNLIKAKGEFVVVKTKDGKFWPLTGVLSMDTYTAKAPSTYNKGGYSGSSTKSTGSTFNNAGIKVGAVLHDAVALYVGGCRSDGSIPAGSHVVNVKSIAEELLSLSYELEANVNAGKYEPTNKNTSVGSDSSTITTTGNASKPHSRSTTTLEYRGTDEETSLDNIDF